MICIYKYKGKDYTKDEFYSLVRTTMVQPRTVQKSIEKENKPINNSDIQLKTNEKPRINEKLRIDVISKFHSTKEQALTAYNQIKDLLKGSYVHQVGDKWKVYAPVQKPRSNQFPQQSISKNKKELPIEQFKEIVDKLYNKFGQKINYKIVEPEEILKYIEEQTGLNREDLQLNLDNTPAVYKDNTILYPKNYLTSEVAFHEFSHPFIDIIVKQNPDLFNNLKNELQTTDSGKLIIEKIKKEYPHLIDEDGSLTEGFWKESIVTALGELASNNLNESKDKGLISYLKDLLKQISQYLRDLFSTPTKVIKPFEIDPNTKLEELASMLNIDNQIDLKEFSSDEIKYGLKAINILQSEKAKNIFDKGNKNKWGLDRILTELQIPKEQKELLLSLNIKDREQLALELASNYSYTVEINTAKTNEEKQVIQRGDNEEFTFMGSTYEYKNGEYLKDDEIIDLIEYESAKHKAFTQPNTQHYSNLTVPGGTNYTENKIETPAIVPSIQGHAEWVKKDGTDNGIGWFRSDEQHQKVNYSFEEWKTKNKEWFKNQGISSESDLKRLYQEEQNSKDFVSGNVVNEIKGSKTRRILEVQSDLFQKGRDKNDLTSQVNDKTDLGFSGTASLEEYLDAMEYSLVEYEGKTKEEAKKIVEQERTKRTTKNSNENQFLQLLNKNNNWVTFFVKSIIQDSAKKGYEKILFPLGETIAKIEQYGEAAKIYAKLLAKKQRGEKLTVQEENAAKEYEELNQKAVIDFYENTVANILRKQGYNPKLITDEYNNTWNEVIIDKKRDLSQIQFQKLTQEEKAKTIEQVTKEHRSITALKDLAAKLAHRIGGKVKFVNKTDADWKGYNQGMTSVLNEAYMTPDTPFHEILAHPIIRAIKNKNVRTTSDGVSDFSQSKLYQSLLKELETGRGKEVFEQVKRDYKLKGGDSNFAENFTGDYKEKFIKENSYTLEEQQEEAIVTLLGMMAADKLDAKKDATLISKLKELWKQISDFVKSLLKQDGIKIDELPINNSNELIQQELNKLLKNGKITKKCD